jgi:myosin light chain 6
MAGLSKGEIEDIREVFDLFDFWDGRDGEVDGFKVADLLRCTGINPTNTVCCKHGGKEKMGEAQYKFEEFLPIYIEINKSMTDGTFADYMEGFKTFDRDGQGYISSAELRHVLTSYGERMEDSEVDKIIKFTDTTEDLDGNIKYEDFIKKCMEGPKL